MCQFIDEAESSRIFSEVSEYTLKDSEDFLLHSLRGAFFQSGLLVDHQAAGSGSNTDSA
ncbi:MAG: hypothetical protein M1546_07200 [Chloroflexi bacterium]|nr:hypothetical protein [Chloroflexota bacterium]